MPRARSIVGGGITFHTFRKTFASNAINAGIPERVSLLKTPFALQR